MELGIGILGYGFMGKTHTHGLINLPLYYSPAPVKVKHISVGNPGDRGRKAAEESGYFRQVTADWRAIVEDPEIGAICVCSPNGFHKEQLLAAIEANKHVYCDKPIAASRAEAREIEAALHSDSYTGKHQMVFQYRFFPATMRAKQLIESGFLGDIYHYRAVYLHSSNMDPTKPIAWKADPSRGGGGTLLDMGVHLLDLMRHLLGEVQAVHGTSRTCIKERPSLETGELVPVTTDDVSLLVLRHAGDVVGTIEASKVAAGACDELRFEIHGSGGAIRFNLMDPNWLEVFDARDETAPLGGMSGFKKVQCLQKYPKPGGGFPNPKFSIGWLRAHMHCMYSFLNCIARDEAPNPSLHDGIRMQAILEACLQSAETGRWADLDG